MPDQLRAQGPRRIAAGLLMAASVALCPHPASAQVGVTISSPRPLNTNAASDPHGDDAAPSIAADGAGHWVAVWQSDENLGGAIGTDRDILVTTSANNGQAWSPPRALNSNASSDQALDFAPQVVSDRMGNWVAAWYAFDPISGALGDDRDVYFAHSSDNGLTWSAATPLNDGAALDTGWDYDVQLAADRAGNWVAVWQSESALAGRLGTDYDILYARSPDGGVTWTAATALNSHAVFDSAFASDAAPHVATDGQGLWVAVWQSEYDLNETIGADRDILFARSDDEGRTWSPAAALNANAAVDDGHDSTPYVATDGLGIWVAVWVSDDTLGETIGHDWDILSAYSIDNARTWTSPVPVNTTAAIDRTTDMDGAPQVVGDPDGNWFVVWHSNHNVGGAIGSDADVLIARSTDFGAHWTTPGALNANAASDTGEDRDPQIATDLHGQWVGVWWSTDTLGGTIGSDQDILTGHFSLASCQAPDTRDCDNNGAPDACEPPLLIQTFIAVVLGTNADPVFHCMADADQDGDTDGEDLRTYLSQWLAP